MGEINGGGGGRATGYQLVVPGLRGDSPEDWCSLGLAVSQVRPVPPAFLISLGSDGLSGVAEDDRAGLQACLAVMRTGLASLLGMIRLVAPHSLRIVMTPVPRSAMSEFHRGAFLATAGQFSEVPARLVALC